MVLVLPMAIAAQYQYVPCTIVNSRILLFLFLPGFRFLISFNKEGSFESEFVGHCAQESYVLVYL